VPLLALTRLAVDALPADLAWPTLSCVCANESDEGNTGGGGGACPWPRTAAALLELTPLAVDTFPADTARPTLSSKLEASDETNSGVGDSRATDIAE
jgi:hypothetical protein